MPPKVPFFYRIVLTVLRFLGFFCLFVCFAFPYEVEYCSFKVCEEFSWDFDENYIESVDCF